MNDKIKCPKCGREEPAFDYAHVCGPIEVKKSFSKLLRQFEKESKLEIFGLGARRDIWEKALEKYAELIVMECTSIVEPTQHHKAFAQGYVGGVDGLELLDSKVKKIKEHFRVEE
jgi:hypothetical protein